jgi:hypothetical protein
LAANHNVDCSMRLQLSYLERSLMAYGSRSGAGVHQSQ